jgi:hypothetical protein
MQQPLIRGLVIVAVVAIGLVTIHGIVSSVANSSPTSTRETLSPKMDGIYYTRVAVPCAIDDSARAALGRAIADNDEEAVQGLMARDKAVLLTKGTRFEVSSDEAPWAWGFVRSGRETGRDCFVPKGVLSAKRAE